MNKIETEVTKMLGIRYPVIGAPMFLVSTPKLMAEIGNAGGIGCMPSLNLRTGEEFREALRETKRLTDAPFGVNFPILGNWRLEEDLQTCIEEGVRLIVTSLGDPTEVIRTAHANDIFVYCDVINMKHAKKVEAAGCDAIIAVGAGAGGHAGAITQYVLVPWLVDAVKVPVIASGAIADGRGLAASLALGAQAAYVGTRFIATPESPADERYKQMIVEASPEDIVYTNKISGHNANFLKASVEESGGKGGAWKDVWSAGHTVGLIHDIKPAGQIVADMVSEYEKIRAGLPALQD